MNHLSQLAHQALNAITQRPQAASAQFGGEATFASILDAQASQSDKIDAHNPKEPDRKPQERRQQKQPVAVLAQKNPVRDDKPSTPKTKSVTTDSKADVRTDQADSRALPATIATAKEAAKYAKHKAKDIADHSPPQPIGEISEALGLSDLPAILVVQEPTGGIKAPPVATGNEADVVTLPVLVGDAAASTTLPAVPFQLQTLPLPVLQATTTAPPAIDETPIPIALNDVLLPNKFKPIIKAAPGLGDEQPDLWPTGLAASPLVAPHDDISVVPAAPTIPADVLATATASAALAPVVANKIGIAPGLLKPLSPVSVSLAQTAPLHPLVTTTATTIGVAAETTAQQVSVFDSVIQAATPANAQTIASDAVAAAPRPVTLNPLLVASDGQQPVAVNPLLNPTLQINPQATPQATVTAVNGSAITQTAAAHLADSQAGIESSTFDIGFSSHSPTRYDAGSVARTGKLSNTIAGAALPANIQVAVQLVRAARNGDKAFNIQLHPAELGRVEVKLEVDSQGAATARILVDSQATLDLLKTHNTGLERALTDAGLKCDAGGISFDLRPNDQNGQNAQQQTARDNSARNAAKNNALPAQSGTADASVDPSIIANLTLSLQPGRVDIKA